MPVGGEPQPHLMKRNALDVRAEFTKLMEVAMTTASPVVKLDTELEARLRGAHEVTLIDTENLVVELQGWIGRLPHADRSDLVGLDQGHPVRTLDRLGHCRGGHPTGGAATDDHIVH